MEFAVTKPITLYTLQEMKQRGEKFACLTAYDALFASLCNNAGIEVLLVGDSLGMVLQGHDSTLPVTMEHMIYHMQCVKRGNNNALLMGDLPFMSYSSASQTLDNAAHLMRAGAHIVKLEGGAWIAESTRLLTERGIPVCAHMGLTPQSINRIGGFRVQGRDPAAATAIIEEAQILEQAGANMLLLECIPAPLAKKVSTAVGIPVIGIGAGQDVDGQIMVLHDLLGISPITPRFVKNFLAESQSGIQGALAGYVAAVKAQRFPAPEHWYNA
jgi:3-methyl-2-oxobutanoate hydroxymethyltransferase